MEAESGLGPSQQLGHYLLVSGALLREQVQGLDVEQPFESIHGRRP